MDDSILGDPQFQRFARHVLDDLVPKLGGSGMVFSLAPKTAADVKWAVELGMSIWLDKPLFILIEPGMKVPEKLVRVADRIIEVDMSQPEKANASIQAAIADYFGGER